MFWIFLFTWRGSEIVDRKWELPSSAAPHTSRPRLRLPTSSPQMSQSSSPRPPSPPTASPSSSWSRPWSGAVTWLVPGMRTSRGSGIRVLGSIRTPSPQSLVRSRIGKWKLSSRVDSAMQTWAEQWLKPNYQDPENQFMPRWDFLSWILISYYSISFIISDSDPDREVIKSSKLFYPFPQKQTKLDSAK